MPDKNSLYWTAYYLCIVSKTPIIGRQGQYSSFPSPQSFHIIGLERAMQPSIDFAAGDDFDKDNYL